MKSAALSMVVNHLSTSIRRQFGGIFNQFIQPGQKRAYDYDFGYPDVLEFQDFYDVYKRSSLARAGITRPIEKTWQDFPWLLEKEDDHDETPGEELIRLAFERVKFWSRLMYADELSRIGKYAGLIFKFADSKKFSEPVQRVNGLDALIDIIPAHEGQLKVSEWYTDEADALYGQPKMYQFIEAPVGTQTNGQQQRSFPCHPDRVFIWSKDGSVNCEEALRPGYNDLIDIKKVNGSGAEGFWKIAKVMPILNMDKEADPKKLATMLGAESVAGIGEKLDEVITDWVEGLDKSLALQGVDTSFPQISLPDPDPFVRNPLQHFAASLPIPMKILVGSQSGERASTEDANEWSQTCQSRRVQMVMPNIMAIVERLVKFQALPKADWFLYWSDLTESKMPEKVDRATKMADVNQKMMGTGTRPVFGVDEIRAVMDYEAAEATEFDDDLVDDVQDEDLPEEKPPLKVVK